MKRITVCLMLMTSSFLAHAASFDCSKAATSVEKLICSDAQVSDLDSQLTQLFRKLLSESTDTDALKSEQRKWLSTVRNKCQDAACLKQTYSDRVAALDQKPDTPTISAPKDESKLSHSNHTDEIPATQSTPTLPQSESTSATPDTKNDSKVGESPLVAQPDVGNSAALKVQASPEFNPIIPQVLKTLTLVIALLIIVGLVKPSLILRWSKSPTRLKVFGYLFPIGLILGSIAGAVDAQRPQSQKHDVIVNSNQTGPLILGRWQCTQPNHPNVIVDFKRDGFAMLSTPPVAGQFDQNAKSLILDMSTIAADGRMISGKYNASISRLDQTTLIFTIPFRQPATFTCTKQTPVTVSTESRAAIHDASPEKRELTNALQQVATAIRLAQSGSASQYSGCNEAINEYNEFKEGKLNSDIAENSRAPDPATGLSNLAAEITGSYLPQIQSQCGQ